MARCGPCMDRMHDLCIPGGDAWRCTCGCAVRTGYWLAETGRYCWRCPRCFYGRGYASQIEAESLHFTHACTARGGEFPVTEQKSLIQRSWEQLDAEVDSIMDLTDNGKGSGADVADALERAKARARGKAEILAMFMVPHFHTADEISAEAGRRWAARKNGEEPVTPGLSTLWRIGMPPRPRPEVPMIGPGAS